MNKMVPVFKQPPVFQGIHTLQITQGGSPKLELCAECYRKVRQGIVSSAFDGGRK